MKPSVGIVVIAYNEMERIGFGLEALAEALSRLNRDSEALVVSDKSTDDTAIIARQYQSLFKESGSRLRVVEPPRRLGVSGARHFSSRTGCTGPAAPGHLGAARTPDAEAPTTRLGVGRTPLSSWSRSPMAGDRNRASPVSPVLCERPVSELINTIIFAAFGLFISLTDGPQRAPRRTLQDGPRQPIAAPVPALFGRV